MPAIKTSVTKPSGLIRRISGLAQASDRTRPKTNGGEQYDGKDTTDYADNVAGDK